ncbi:MAG: nucleoside deaminase [Mariprofundales bacterium]|nr:nucleoside deaminase [Mariprofundales bacterium]
MAWVLDLLEQHLLRQSGGPFAAALFVDERSTPLAIGLNVVESAHCSLAHAEMVALAAAQQSVASYDLSTVGACQLVSSCEPCAMCYGALPWSGIDSLVCGADSADACALGFDEGGRDPQWQRELERRSISVTLHIERSRAAALMQRYASSGGTIYNGGGG